MTLIDFLFVWTLRSAVLIGLVAIPAFLWKRASAAQRHALWLAALLGIVALPFLTDLPKWRLPSAPVEPVVLVPRIAPPVTEPLPQVSVPVATPLPVTQSWTWQETLVWLWALGFLYQLTRWAIGQWTLRRWRAGSEPYSIKQHQGLPVRCHRDVPGPVVIGLFRPGILLPRSAEEWDVSRMKAVLAHELAHLQRGDLWSHGLGRLLLIVQWWNPLLHLAVRQMEQASESACDDRVLREGIPAADYSMALLEVAREAGVHRAFPGCAVTMARTLPIERRLRKLLDTRQSRRRLRAGAFLGISFVMACLAVMVGTFTSEAQEPEVVLGAPEPAKETADLWKGLAAFPADIKITSEEGMTVTSIGKDSERVTFKDAKLSYKGFVVQASEIEMVREEAAITVTANAAQLAGPNQVSGSCGLLTWKISSGNTESIQLREGVVMEMVDEESGMTRRTESKNQAAYIDIRFQDGEFASFHQTGAMTVTLDKKAERVQDDRVRGFLGIIMLRSAVSVDTKLLPAVQVKALLAGGGAASAGIQEDDFIYALNGTGFLEDATGEDNGSSMLEGFRERIRSCRPGSVVTIDLLRGDEKMKFDVTLGKVGGWNTSELDSFPRNMFKSPFDTE